MKPISFKSTTVSAKLSTRLLFDQKWARQEQVKKLTAICQSAKPYNVKNKGNLVWFVGDTYSVLMNRSANQFSDFTLTADLNTNILDGFAPVITVVEKQPTSQQKTVTLKDGAIKPVPKEDTTTPTTTQPEKPEKSVLQTILDTAEATYQEDVARAKRRFEYNITKDLLSVNMEEIENFYKLAHDIVKGKNTVQNHAKIQPLIESLKKIRTTITTIESKLK